MPGVAENYNEFYQVTSGDQCDTIASAHSITVDQLGSWNGEINAGLSHHPCLLLSNSTDFTNPYN
jgi:hypothetical protein